MSEVKRSWNVLSKERRDSAVKEIITFFKEERNEEIGMIAAESFLDFFLESVGNDVYNKGIEDSKNKVKQLFDNLDVEIDVLLKN